MFSPFASSMISQAEDEDLSCLAQCSLIWQLGQIRHWMSPLKYRNVGGGYFRRMSHHVISTASDRNLWEVSCLDYYSRSIGHVWIHAIWHMPMYDLILHVPNFLFRVEFHSDRKYPASSLYNHSECCVNHVANILNFTLMHAAVKPNSHKSPSRKSP